MFTLQEKTSETGQLNFSYDLWIDCALCVVYELYL